ncbi:hypothetical protein PsorP6_011884 [Peronosclerospora sorghi]|uniref:Uncharacterized protein n=1 Tax=Peronosclerospora sorghi TaxID=230839 RepID=A0ACC0WJK2_9STRA|nr:hypothetical protein PsorP6_011884 [Peronosclerospora sorghi]
MESDRGARHGARRRPDGPGTRGSARAARGKVQASGTPSRQLNQWERVVLFFDSHFRRIGGRVRASIHRVKGLARQWRGCRTRLREWSGATTDWGTVGAGPWQDNETAYDELQRWAMRCRICLKKQRSRTNSPGTIICYLPAKGPRALNEILTKQYSALDQIVRWTAHS